MDPAPRARGCSVGEQRCCLLIGLLSHPRVDAAAIDSRGQHFLFYWAACVPFCYPVLSDILKDEAIELGLPLKVRLGGCFTLHLTLLYSHPHQICSNRSAPDLHMQDREGNSLLHILAQAVASAPSNFDVSFHALDVLKWLLEQGVNPR